MKLLKVFLAAVCLLAGGSAFALEPTFRSASIAPVATPPALYSFADVYRLTVSGPAAGFPTESAEAPVRVAVSQPAGGAELRFLVSTVPQPDKWLLLLAGVALAGWVAHRRLVHSL